ncbi:AraC family transcriptional regulator [Aquimarina sp. MAR_2010_214]|uniref:AraC family transcriptional regulator n=1 Tax=Aquimarina sp. MAR_2010_214 TaxID=1250026 RepID=UPI000C700707|nr:AraC family transcriptional regulator [Aquimarina sp. MAR_2010_214]PKV51632.1 AraC family transcriptional regulator [Aquimarina sp. MAR_2010_214]
MNTNSEERIVHFLPDYGINGCLQFGYYKYSKAQPQLPIHEHRNTIELCFCIKGEQHYVIGEELFQLHGNDILIIPPNKEHSTGEYPEDKGELFWLQINCSDNQHRLCNLSRGHSNYLFRELKKASERTFKGAFQVKFILEKLLNELKTSSNILSEITINQLIVQTILEVLTLSKRKQGSLPLKRLNDIDTYILNNLHRIIYVDELANICNVSVGYFKFWFKNIKGIPPKEYINRLKIEQSKIDLLKKDSITTVAFDLGFSSSQYFSTTFKKFTGYTPKTYISLNNISS